MSALFSNCVRQADSRVGSLSGYYRPFAYFATTDHLPIPVPVQKYSNIDYFWLSLPRHKSKGILGLFAAGKTCSNRQLLTDWHWHELTTSTSYFGSDPHVSPSFQEVTWQSSASMAVACVEGSTPAKFRMIDESCRIKQVRMMPIYYSPGGNGIKWSQVSIDSFSWIRTAAGRNRSCSPLNCLQTEVAVVKQVWSSMLVGPHGRTRQDTARRGRTQQKAWGWGSWPWIHVNSGLWASTMTFLHPQKK